MTRGFRLQTCVQFRRRNRRNCSNLDSLGLVLKARERSTAAGRGRSGF
jgi:hypothetical protein